MRLEKFEKSPAIKARSSLRAAPGPRVSCQSFWRYAPQPGRSAISSLPGGNGGCYPVTQNNSRCCILGITRGRCDCEGKNRHRAKSTTISATSRKKR